MKIIGCNCLCKLVCYPVSGINFLEQVQEIGYYKALFDIDLLNNQLTSPFQ
jgi:hypothetical protein